MHFRFFRLESRSTHRTYTGASTTFDAGIRVDFIFAITFRDRADRTFRCASPTHDAIFRNSICHGKHTSFIRYSYFSTNLCLIATAFLTFCKKSGNYLLRREERRWDLGRWVSGAAGFAGSLGAGASAGAVSGASSRRGRRCAGPPGLLLGGLYPMRVAEMMGICFRVVNPCAAPAPRPHTAAGAR